jgi:hypothetical protein
VGDAAGYVTVDVHEAIRAERSRMQWDQDHPGATTLDELVTRERPVHWVVLHAACDQVDERGPYTIEVERIRSAWDALAWTDHLIGKTWVAHTDWGSLINQIAKAGGSTEAH